VIGMSWTNVGLGCLGCCSCPVDACAQTVISLLIHCWLLTLCLILILLLLKWHEEIRTSTYIMLMLMLLHWNPTCDDDDDGEGEELSAVAFAWVVMMPNLKFVDILTCAHCSIMMGNPPRLSSSSSFHQSFLTLPAHHMPSLLNCALLESPHNVDCAGALCAMPTFKFSDKSRLHSVTRTERKLIISSPSSSSGAIQLQNSLGYQNSLKFTTNWPNLAKNRKPRQTLLCAPSTQSNSQRSSERKRDGEAETAKSGAKLDQIWREFGGLNKGESWRRRGARIGEMG
jgi:hypothetical protein